MEKSCKDLTKHATRIFNYEKKEIILLTDEANKFYKERFKSFKKRFSINNYKKHHKLRDHCHYSGKFRGAAHSICNLR